MVLMFLTWHLTFQPNVWQHQTSFVFNRVRTCCNFLPFSVCPSFVLFAKPFGAGNCHSNTICNIFLSSTAFSVEFATFWLNFSILRLPMEFAAFWCSNSSCNLFCVQSGSFSRFVYRFCSVSLCFFLTFVLKLCFFHFLSVVYNWFWGWFGFGLRSI